MPAIGRTQPDTVEVQLPALLPVAEDAIDLSSVLIEAA